MLLLSLGLLVVLGLLVAVVTWSIGRRTQGSVTPTAHTYTPCDVGVGPARDTRCIAMRRVCTGSRADMITSVPRPVSTYAWPWNTAFRL